MLQTSSAPHVVVQVIAGLAVAVLVVAVTMLLTGRESVLVTPDVVRQDEKTLVLDGWVHASAYANKRFSVNNPAVADSIRLPRSINRRGGCQFTYLWWMRIDDTNPGNIANSTIFLRGNTTPYKITTRLGTPLQGAPPVTLAEETAALVRCPLVRFGSSFRDIVVQLNTAKDLKYTFSVRADASPNHPVARQNLTSLLPNAWFMHTLVVEDNYRPGQVENGLRVRYFINGVVYKEDTADNNPVLRDNAVLQNDGALWLFPNKAPAGLKLANLTYFNRALSDDDVTHAFHAGFNPNRLEPEERHNYSPLFLSALNHVDVYNA
jgi:hypothetical protein